MNTYHYLLKSVISLHKITKNIQHFICLDQRGQIRGRRNKSYFIINTRFKLVKITEPTCFIRGDAEIIYVDSKKSASCNQLWLQHLC